MSEPDGDSYDRRKGDGGRPDSAWSEFESDHLAAESAGLSSTLGAARADYMQRVLTLSPDQYEGESAHQLRLLDEIHKKGSPRRRITRRDRRAVEILRAEARRDACYRRALCRRLAERGEKDGYATDCSGSKYCCDYWFQIDVLITIEHWIDAMQAAPDGELAEIVHRTDAQVRAWHLECRTEFQRWERGEWLPEEVAINADLAQEWGVTERQAAFRDSGLSMVGFMATYRTRGGHIAQRMARPRSCRRSQPGRRRGSRRGTNSPRAPDEPPDEPPAPGVAAADALPQPRVEGWA